MYDPTKPYNENIIKLIKETWNTPYLEVKKGIARKKFSYPEYHHSDGIGTKGIYHWQSKTLENAVIDALAMNLNDLAMERAIPYAIIDHLFIPQDNEKYILRIINKLAKECRKRDIAITGGETAIHSPSKEIEISLAMLGFIKNAKENQFRLKDVLIGIESSGLHSNGFTRVREVFGDNIRPEFTEPTIIYSDMLLELNEKYDINGMMHITGGAFTKLKKPLKEGSVRIFESKLKPPPIFYELYEKGVSDVEMYKTFNCGIGFVLSIPQGKAASIISNIKKNGLKAEVIGEVVFGKSKIKIKSAFSNQEIEL